MTAREIKKACALFHPDDPLSKFANAYRCLDFGYRYVSAAAAGKLRYKPWFPVGKKWLWKAYVFYRGYGKAEQVEEAEAIKRGGIGPEGTLLRSHRDLLEALLMAEAAGDKGAVAMWQYSSNSGVAEAYAELFFDIADRASDDVWLASVVYPSTKLDELRPDYFSEDSFATILRRVAYNHGGEQAMALAGVKNKLLHSRSQYNAAEAASMLELRIMQNALQLDKIGLLNQPAMHGVGMARGILAASKQGGAEEARTHPLVAAAAGMLAAVRAKGAYSPVAVNVESEENNAKNLLHDNVEGS